MAEVPRIVRERLSEQVAAGEHPDANLLSAFAERALTEPERAQLLDHLSRCADCREVVALAAQSQVEEEQLVPAAVPAAQAARRSWWRSPVIHWSALTAAALVVMIAVGERMRLRPEHSASAPAIARHELSEKQIASAPATAPAPSEQKKSQKLAARTRRRAQAFNAPNAMGAVSGRKLASGKTAAAGSAGIVAQNLPPPPAAPPMKPHANADAAATTTDGPAFESANEQARAKAAPAPSATVGGIVGGAAAAPVPKSEATILLQRPGANFTRRAFLGPRWSVSDSGALQRSFDGGRSWKEVAVAEGVSFRAVAVVGTEVWAGGSGGALFHSADGGEHWARVRVQVNDRTPSGDIVRIEFADAQNGVVTTSTGETWTTSDAGATWRWQ